MIFRPNFNLTKTEYSIPIFDQTNFGQLLILCLICLIYGSSAGINLSNFSLFLGSYNIPIIEVSKILSFEFLGNILVAPFVIILVRKFDIKKLLIISILLRSCFLVIFALGMKYDYFIIGIIGFGIWGFLLYTVIFQSVNFIAPPTFRASYLSLASISFGIGLGAGPVILFLLDLHNSQLAIISSSVLSLVMIPLINFLNDKYNITYNSYEINIARVLKFAYIPVIAAVTAEFVFYALHNFLPLYLLDLSKNTLETNVTTSMFSFGVIIFSFHCAKILDRYNRINIMMLFTLTAAILIQLLPITLNNIIFSGLVVALIGGCTSGILIGSLAILGDKFSGDDFVLANSLVHGMSIVGGYSGIKTTGEIISKVGDKGLIYSISSVFLVLLALLFIKSYRINKR